MCMSSQKKKRNREFFLLEWEKKNILFKSEKKEAWESVCVCEREDGWSEEKVDIT